MMIKFTHKKWCKTFDDMFTFGTVFTWTNELILCKDDIYRSDRRNINNCDQKVIRLETKCEITDVIDKQYTSGMKGIVNQGSMKVWLDS